MIEQRYKIEWTSASDSSTEDITEAVEINEDEGIETTVDKFNFRILMGSMSATPAIRDLIKIYFDEGPDTPTTLVMDGEITELAHSYNVDGTFIVIRGMNRLERLLNSPRPFTAAVNFEYAAADAQDGVARHGVPGIIANLIDLANDTKREGQTDITYDVTSLPPTVIGGGAFPDLPQPYYKDWQSVFEHIETLSRNEWTQDGHYVFFLDTSNKFNWVPLDSAPYSDPVSSFVLEGNDVIGWSSFHAVFDVINAVIMNAGKDLNGNTILAFGLDVTSMGQYGIKWKYEFREEIANQYIAQNPGENNDTVRTAVKALAAIEINKILALYGNPRYKLDLTMLGSTSFAKGKVYSFKSTELGWTVSKKLRLFSIQHIFNTNGWTTSLHFEEDDTTIGAAL